LTALTFSIRVKAGGEAMEKRFLKSAKDNEGSTAIEYALIAVVTVLVIALSFPLVVAKVQGLYDLVAGAF
jgi:Flp pilus assembly pilin Flp